MGTLLTDLRYASRMLRKHPGFTLIAVLTLSLGIGANTAVFSLVNALFLRQLPVKDAHQLVGIYDFRDGRVGGGDLSYADYLDYRDRNTVFSGLAAYSGAWVWMTEGETSSEFRGGLVSANYFSVLGVRPALGRFFLPEEDRVPDAHPVAVLSHRLWQQRFKGDPGLPGKMIRMNRLAFTVVGIAPKDWIVIFYAYGMSGLTLRLDSLTLGVTFALSVFTGILFGLAPALQSTRPNLVLALKDEGRTLGYRRSWSRSALVVVQVALSVLLLVGAGLLLRSLSNLIKNPGFDPLNIAHFRLRPGRLGYDVERARAYHREVLRRVETVPGVQSAVLLAWGTPARSGGDAVSIGLPGQAPVQPESARRIDTHEITPGYLATLKIPLLAGREFDERDRQGAPSVAIVNETLARQLWPGGNATGQSLIVDGSEHAVIGVAKDAQPHSSNRAAEPFLYLAYWQRELTDSRLLVRVAGDPRSLLPVLRREVVAVDPDVHVGQEMSLDERTSFTFQAERLMGNALTGAGLIALFLSAIGLYGLLAFAVSQRSREIGIRMALGAQRMDVLRLVVGQGLKLTLLGVAIGLVAAFALTRTLAGLPLRHNGQ